jgi:type I restriction enzyme S subunit
MSESKETEFGNIPNNWNFMSASEYCSKITDGTHDSPKRQSVGKYLITSKHIKGREIDFENANLISKEDFEKINKRSYVEQWDVIISMIGEYCGFTYIVRNNIIDFAVKNVGLFKTGSELKALWLHYYLNSTVGKYVLDINKSGSSQPYLSLGSLRELPILVPPLIEQMAIVSLLSSLDDKIDLLHRQNATLEKMAETLFRQWFVEEAKEDWVRTKIGDVLDTVLGGTPSTKKPEYWDGNIPWINSGEVNNFRILQCSRFITELGLKKSNTKLLPVGTTVLAITGATLGQVSLLEIDTCANQSVVGIIPNGTLPKEFIFLWIKMKISEIILSETGGAQPHINKNDINETDIVIPDSDYLNKIKLTIEPLFKKITHNSFQIRTLTALRDTLLPKLMSGEVRVD